MKIRQGYVSNSSSSSFVLRNCDKFSEEELELIKGKASADHWWFGSGDEENSIEFSTYQGSNLCYFIQQIIDSKFPSIEDN